MVKIKSWTGDEVDARVGMACIVGTDNFIQIITNITDSRIHFGRSWLPASLNNTVKMINCPFRVMDEIEYIFNPKVGIASFGIGWQKGRIETEVEANIANGSAYMPLYIYRHTNPSLRTSEEYENEKQ